MMKRILCLLFCLALLAPQALAEDTSGIDIAALMARQVSGNSAFRTQWTAELSENAPYFMDAALWKTLSALAPDTSFETTYVFSRAGETLGNSQAALYARRGEDTLASLYLNGRGEEWQLWGDAAEGQTLILPRDTSLLLRDRYLTLAGWGGVLLRGLGFMQSQVEGQQEGAWPAPFRFLTRVFTETENWKGITGGLLDRYTEQISAWMQAHTAITLQRSAGGALTTASELRADGAELAAEALELLRMFYSDGTLRNVLRNQMTGIEANSYLEPGMLTLFETMLNTMELPEELVLSRVFDTEGQQTHMSLRMPLADGAVLIWEQAGETNTYGLEKGDRSLRLGVRGDRDTGWQGDFSLKRGEAAYSGSYQLYVSMQPTYEDETEKGSQRRQSGDITLLITPAAGESFPAQTITAAITAWAGLENDRPAHWNADIEWSEPDSGAYLLLHIKTRTGAALQQTEAVGEPVELAVLDQTQREAKIKQFLMNFINILQPVTIDR